MRPLLILLALSIPLTAFAQGDDYDPTVPWPITPIAADATFDDCGTWFYNITDSYGLLRMQYPKDNEWYYQTIEKIVTFGADRLTIQDTSTSQIKATGPMPDPNVYTTLLIKDIDPASLTVSEVLPFDDLLGAKSVLGKEKGDYAAYYAEYVLPAWYVGVHKPATTKVWKLTIGAREKKPLFTQEAYAPTNAKVDPGKQTVRPPVAAIGILLTDKHAAEESVKVLKQMIELGGDGET